MSISYIINNNDSTLPSQTIYGNINIAGSLSASTYLNVSAGPSLWTTGSTGTYSIKSVNDSTIDATGNYAYAQGYSTTAIGESSHSEGSNTKSYGSNSHAEGTSTIASGASSHVEGQNSIARGNVSHAEGIYSTSLGIGSHAEGGYTTAIGNYSHAGGYYSISQGDFSFAHSSGSTVTGARSVVLGGKGINATTDDTVYMPKVELVETGQGIIMKSPDGTRYKLTIANGGTVTVSLA